MIRSRPKSAFPSTIPVKGFLIALASLAAGCSDSPDGEATGVGANEQVDAVFDHFTVPGSPGAAVMVIREGDVIHSKGYGLADLGSGEALGPTTPIRLASVSKQFTTMAIMILQERGELAYDDPVTKWIPELRRFEGITVRHLMHHTSGLPDYYDVFEEFADQVSGSDGDPLLTNVDLASIFERWGDPEFEPGDRHQYSNPGYEILGLIIERVSGATFGEFLAENIFDPLEMTNAVVRDHPNLVIPDRAVGYRPGSGGEEWIENDDHPGNWIVGAGGVYASLNDFFAWDQALYKESLVGHETLEEAFTPATLNDGDLSEYGFGWGLQDRLGRRAVQHGGSWVGFRTHIVRFLEERLTVIVLSNATASAGDLADEVARIFLVH